MPKSKIRKKDAYIAPVDRRNPVKVRGVGPSHPLYIVIMLAVMVLGLAWLVVNYIAGEQIAVMRELGSWNFLIGFVLIIAGLLMTMRWR